MNIKDIHTKFVNPGTEYRGKPFWSWNGELKADEAVRQAEILGNMGFGGYFMHSRCGLITEYLGDEWFEITNAVADASEKSGLEAWLYDEDRWPSGSAGGKATEDPKYRMKSLYLFEVSPDKFSFAEDIFCAFAIKVREDKISIDGYKKISSPDDISAYIEGDGEAKIAYFKVITDTPNNNYNGNTYLDTLSVEAVEKFIEITHEEYKKRCGNRIGTSIKGIFTDEPHRGHAMDNYSEKDGVRSSAIFYTEDIFAEFEKRYGYNAIDVLPEIFYRLHGEAMSKVRIDFFDLGCNLLNERFAIPINKWCEKNGMILTGHVLHEDSLTNQTVPNGSLMRFYINMGNPGIDILGNSNRSYWAAKQCSSICRQFDKKWMLSELYGCSGWEFSLRSHKTMGDWQALFGVNVRCPHLSWYTMEGECKRDYPASVSFQSPYWQDYNYVESYFARLGLILSEGEAVCDTLVINPIESVWGTAHLSWSNWIYPKCEETYSLEKTYADTFMSLAGAKVDFDYGEEQIMAQYAKVKDGKMTIGKCSYSKIVISGALTLRKSTLSLLVEFLKQGGTVVFAGDMPKYIDGTPSKQCYSLCEKYETAFCIELDALGDKMKALDCSMISSTATDKIFNQIRKTEDSIISVWLNTDSEKGESFSVSATLTDDYISELWSAESGEKYIYPSVYSDGKLTLEISLEPAQTRIIVFRKGKSEAEIFSTSPLTETGKITDGEFEYILDEPNVAVLDYASYKFEGDNFSPLGEVLKIDSAIRDRVGIEHRGGEMLQPWFAKQNHTEEYGKLTVRYPFSVESLPEGDIFLAAERPENIDYYCNGVKLSFHSFSDWWVDNSFIKMPIPKNALKTGKNEITAICNFKRTTNIEAVYIIGNFGVNAKAGESSLTTMPKTLSVDNMAKRNLPFYSGRASILIPYEKYASLVDEKADKVFVKIPHFTGSNIAVEYGDAKQIIAWEPFTADITEAVKNKLTLKITQVNTRRNSFGPLHIVPTIHEAYGPYSFMTTGDEWSDEYSFIKAEIGKITFLCR